MPIVTAQRMWREYIRFSFDRPVSENYFLIPVTSAIITYSHWCTQKNKVSSYVSRIFNEKFEPVSRPKVYRNFNLVRVKTEKEGYKYSLDLSDLVEKLSIPNGYYIEILVMAFTGQKEKVIYPFEVKVDSVPELKQQVESELETLSKISTIFEASSVFKEIGLKDIAKELSDGYTKFETGDYDGVIKAYRKVVEGFRNYFKKEVKEPGTGASKRLIDSSASRTENLVDFLSKTYSLLSNFGEHYGTKAFDEEAIFTRKLVESISEYISKKLRK
jgi:hypothetical protein